MSIFRTGTPVWKKVLATLLCVGVVAGGAYGIKKIHDRANEDLKTINPTFHVGGLDENGEYIDTNESLYSEPFDVKGLQTSLDFENDIKYEIYFYENDVYKGKSNLLDSEFDYYDCGDDIIRSGKLSYGYVPFSLIDKARVVIYPQWTNVEIPEDKDEEDVKIVKWSNILEFTSQLELKVLKDQSKVNLFESKFEGITINKGCYFNNEDVTNSNYNYVNLTVESSYSYKIKVIFDKNVTLEEGVPVITLASLNNPSDSFNIINTCEVDGLTYTLETCDESYYQLDFKINYKVGNEPRIEIIDLKKK